jgi:Uma2 family endonuclease
MAIENSDDRRLTREEYERLVIEGFFEPDARIELLEGLLVEKAPNTPPHATGITIGQIALRRVFTEGFEVWTQSPLALTFDSEPEPDVSVIPGTYREYVWGHPTSAVLVIEVAESSLAQDRGVKARLYARAGIPDYWITNLADRCVEVYRVPKDGAYTSRIVLREGDFVSPLARQDVKIAIADLLPLPRR